MIICLDISSAYNTMQSSLLLCNEKLHLLHMKSYLIILLFQDSVESFNFLPSITSPSFSTYNRERILQKPWGVYGLSLIFSSI